MVRIQVDKYSNYEAFPEVVLGQTDPFGLLKVKQLEFEYERVNF